MKYEELHRKVFDELEDGSGQPAYDAALLAVLAPYLHKHGGLMKKFIAGLGMLLILTLASYGYSQITVSSGSNVTITGALPAGTNTLGKVDLNAGSNAIGTVGVTSITAGETHVGEIGGNTALVAITPTVTAGAYHANDVVGGKQTIASALRVSGGTVVLQSIVVRDLAAQNAVLQIMFFNADPATGTYTDNAALDLDDTDSGLFIGSVTVNASDYISLADNSIACVRNIGLPLKATTGTSLYALIRTTGTPTYASTSDLKITFGLLRD